MGDEDDALHKARAADAQSAHCSVLARMTGKLYAGSGSHVQISVRQAAIQIGRWSVNDLEPVGTVSLEHGPVDRITVAVIYVPETNHYYSLYVRRHAR